MLLYVVEKVNYLFAIQDFSSSFLKELSGINGNDFSGKLVVFLEKREALG